MVKVYDVTIFLIIFLLALEYSPSWTSGVHVGKTIKELIQPTLSNRKQGIYLGEYGPEYSIILNLLEKNGAADKPKAEKEQGEFFVKAPTNYGLMVVIQFLSLRTQIRGPNLQKTYTYCRDYLQLSDARNKESPEICGYLYIRDNNLTPDKLLGPRSFYSSMGEINVKLFIDNSTQEEMTENLWNTVQLVFTAVSDCQNGGGRNIDEFVRPCYPNASTGISSNVPSANCISSSLFCDDYYNCGFEGQLVGVDEVDCVRNNNLNNKPAMKQEEGSRGNSFFMILCIVFGVIIILVFIGAYVVAEMNVPFLTCRRLQRGSSTTGISKANEKDEASSSTQSPSNYSSFTIEESR